MDLAELEKVFGPVDNSGPELPPNLSSKEAAQALRDWQEENPWDDFTTSVAGGTPYGMADLAASRTLDEPLWMQLLYAAGVIPAVGPTSKAARKAIELMGDLPTGGIKSFLENLYKKGKERSYEDIVDLFTPEGDISSFHGSSSPIPEFTTEGLKQNLETVDRTLRPDLNAGPGTYTSSDFLLPLALGNRGASTQRPTNMYELILPREDIPRYLAQDFKQGTNTFGFADQTDEVKDALSELYPGLSDDLRMDLYRMSKMGTDSPFGIGETMSGESPDKIRNLVSLVRGGAEIRGFEEANRVARNAGILGNVHSESGINFAHFDPDRLGGGGTYSASPLEWLKASDDILDSPLESPRAKDVLEQLAKEYDMKHIPGFEDLQGTTSAREYLDLTPFILGRSR